MESTSIGDVEEIEGPTKPYKIRLRGRLFFSSLIAKLCAKAGVVVAEEEEKHKVKPAIDLVLTKKLRGDLAQKKSRAFISKNAKAPSEATPTPTKSQVLVIYLSNM